ncbi:PH domain-containing protein [Agromyces sp. CF514]|uniref:PH domain-containing protein n=1 Tax=Agromyces sp. CF514 TaxID=1881031 RepID=UPI0008E91BFF|nr:PH domain-containing protein [Agromyces sp. CF514]SFR69166.1 PH domain-containing protein [Agromyces sp. CF514]
MAFGDPRVERHLIADEGEFVVDEVRKHWAAVAGAILEALAAIPVLLLILWVPSQAYWVPLLLAVGLVVHASWRIMGARMDRFVITNMRVFRVHGILTQNIATMPLARILDISVHRPLIGRILGYGHFVFESAAQEQGLRDIRFVPKPNERGLTIQRVIQRAGLRGSSQSWRQDDERREREAAQAAAAAAAAQSAVAAPLTAPQYSTSETAEFPSEDLNTTAEMPWWRAQ